MGAAHGTEASLPQASHRITNWVASDKGVWVEAGNQWYFGEFLGPCTGARSSNALGFRFNPNGSLDRFSGIVVGRAGRQHQSCPFRSFVTSEGPPSGQPRHSKAESAGE